MFLKRVVEHRIFETMIMLVILISCITLAMNKIYPKNDSTSLDDKLEMADLFFLGIFFIECVLKIITYGLILHPKSYLRNMWNVLDFSIVFIGIVSLILKMFIQSKIDIKALRAFRVLRPLRLVKQVQSLQIVVNSILIALIPLANVGLILLCLLIIFAILGMSIFIGKFHSTCYNNVTYQMMPNPVPCNSIVNNLGFNCSNAGSLPRGQSWECYDKDSVQGLVPYPGPNYGINNFDNMGLALITVFQITTRQGWTIIMYSATNIFGYNWPWIYFVSLVIIGSYFLFNLVIAVLCGEFIKEKLKVERRSKYFTERQTVKEMLDYLNYKEWIECGEKIHKGCDDDTVSHIDIRPDEELSNEEEDHRHYFENFKKSLAALKKKWKPYKTKSRQYLLGVIKSRIYFIVILALVFINCAIMASEFNNQPAWLNDLQDYSNAVFVIMFTIEMVLKLCTLGPKNYFSKIFNVYDFLVISISLIEISLTMSHIMPQIGFSILRSLRLLRIFKLTQHWDYMRSLANNMIRSIKSILSLLLLLALFIAIFSLLGMQIFGGKYNFNTDKTIRTNYNDLLQAVISVFQLITGEHWNEEMYNGVQALGGIKGSGSIAVLYFVSVVLIGNYILLNVFFAIVLEILASSENKDKSKEKHKDAESESSDLDPDEREVDVPVVDHLVMVNGCPLMPPNLESDIISLDIVKTKCRKYADSEKRVRMVIKIPEEEQSKFQECGKTQVKYDELYGEDEEDAITLGEEPSNKSALKKMRAAYPKNKIDKMPMGKSFLMCSSDNKFRRICYIIISHSLTKKLVLAIIICSSLQLAFTDPINTETTKSRVLLIFDYAFTGVFALELMLNLIAFGVIFHKGAYLRNVFNWIDFIVVAIGIVDMLNDFTKIKISALKTVRIIRIIKILREIKQAKELKHVINSLIIALSNMWKILLVTVLLQFTFAVMGVIMFKGTFYRCTDPSRTTKERCMGTFISYTTDGLYTATVQDRSWSNYPLNYDNILQAMLTLFVVSTYQGYPHILYMSIDAINAESVSYFNNNRAIFLFYLLYFIVIKFFLLNIFIGFVVISYQKAREMQFKTDEMNKNQKECIAFVLKARPAIKFIPTVRYQYYLWQVVISKKFDYAIFLIIILNIVSMSATYDGAPEKVQDIHGILNFIFITLFTLEAILKMIAFNVRNYFDDGMNIFDLIVLVGSYIDIVFRDLNITASVVNISIFRLFRALRLVKLLMKIVAIRKMIWTFIKAFKTLPWVILLIFLVFFMYSIVGMQFFGPIGLTNPGSAITPNNNFQTLLNSFILLFRCATGENWQDIMISCSDPIKSQCDNSLGSCGSILSYFYFCSFILVCTYLIVNLFLAVLVYNFDYLTMDLSILSPHHLQEFTEKWSEFDIAARGRIKPLDLVNLLTKISPPLGFGKSCSHERCLQRLMLMNMPLEKDGTILFHAVMFSLIRMGLKIKVPLGVKDPKSLDEYNEELRGIIRKLWPHTSSSLLEQIIPSNMKEAVTVGKYYATFVIQNMFRKWKLKKQEKEVENVMIDPFTAQEEHDVNKVTGFVLHKEENLNTEPEEPSALAVVQEKYDKFTDLIWNNLKSIFTIPEDNETTE